ncbi:hypothetical protein [Paenibacillus rhizoplanae]|uniref:Uncharacterized protein n=1 Tax=Paenibacillus rhizoplanae TaxID=1917181 RepID=A0ABW5FEH3_9BACL
MAPLWGMILPEINAWPPRGNGWTNGLVAEGSWPNQGESCAYPQVLFFTSEI